MVGAASCAATAEALFTGQTAAHQRLDYFNVSAAADLLSR